MTPDLRVYVVTDRSFRGRTHEEVARAAVAGGATALQLRDKRATGRELLLWARTLRDLARRERVLFVVNDRVDVALAAEADGAHVGDDDLPVVDVRRLLGPDRVVGASAGTVEDAVRAEREGADYLGVGPVFPTGTKPDAGAAIGVDGLRAIARAVRIPVVGIGGITADNAAEVIRAGAAGVAVISAVADADDMVQATRRLREAVDRALGERGGARK
ncbi:MAG: thiamine phosphate synthase [Armatimonadota bacterium]|nr:thiamine phosphate synthase [Armatimonadota bacterium]MDW8155134.1 thiamine phosphate synthase [Armatimonadota bacterium]